MMEQALNRKMPGAIALYARHGMDVNGTTRNNETVTVWGLAPSVAEADFVALFALPM